MKCVTIFRTSGLQEIRANTQQMGQLVDDLLAFSQLG
jgi:hypothetical protein